MCFVGFGWICFVYVSLKNATLGELLQMLHFGQKGEDWESGLEMGIVGLLR